MRLGFSLGDDKGKCCEVEEGLTAHFHGGGPFSKKPPTTGGNVLLFWSGLVVKVDRQSMVVVVENNLRDALDDFKGIFHTTIDGIHVTFDESDPMGERLPKSIGRMADYFKYESTNNDSILVDKPSAKLRLKCTPILAEYPDTDANAWRLAFLDFKDGDEDFECKRGYELEKSHEATLTISSSSDGESVEHKALSALARLPSSAKSRR